MHSSKALVCRFGWLSSTEGRIYTSSGEGFVGKRGEHWRTRDHYTTGQAVMANNCKKKFFLQISLRYCHRKIVIFNFAVLLSRPVKCSLPIYTSIEDDYTLPTQFIRIKITEGSLFLRVYSYVTLPIVLLGRSGLGCLFEIVKKGKIEKVFIKIEA